MRNSSRIYSKIRSLYLLAFLLAIAAGASGLRAEEEETARLLVERLPEHAESRYHHSDMAPSGDKVAFSVSTGGWNASTIWIYDIPSREMRQLTYPDTSIILGDVLAQWSPNGETIAFASDRGGENSLYLVSSNGGEVRRLTPQPLRDDLSPWACRFSWSPDGERIAFSDGDEEGADLFAIRLNDGATEQLTDHAGIEQYPDWSGDGGSIVYVGDQHGSDGLWIYELATRTERKVPTGMTLMAYPVWSPDGEWIAFQRLGITGMASYLVSTQGGAVRKIGPGQGYVNWGATWDPDGNHLLSWGQSGTGPGEFNTVHNVATDKDGLVYIADRENHRVQVFTSDGRYITQWGNLAMASCIDIERTGDEIVYVGEFFAGIRENPAGMGNWTGMRLGPRVTIMDKGGNILTRVGDMPIGEAAGQFIAPHGIAVDSHGDVYVAEVSYSVLGGTLEPTREVKTIQKLVRRR